MKFLKTILVTLTIFALSFNPALAANTHSIDLEADSSQSLSIADASQTGLDLSTNFTIEAWVKVEELPTTLGHNMTIVSKFTTNVPKQEQYATLFEGADNKLTAWYCQTIVTSYWTHFSSTAPFLYASDVGQWVHIAIVAIIASKSILMYKNGVATSTTANISGATSIQNSTAMFYVGDLISGAETNQFDGLIDDVRIYKVARSAEEIASDYQQELTNFTNVVGYWKLNNDLTDSSGNGNTLTNNNSATFTTDVPFSGVASGWEYYDVE